MEVTSETSNQIELLMEGCSSEGLREFREYLGPLAEAGKWEVASLPAGGVH